MSESNALTPSRPVTDLFRGKLADIEESVAGLKNQLNCLIDRLEPVRNPAPRPPDQPRDMESGSQVLEILGRHDNALKDLIDLVNQTVDEVQV